MVFKQKSPVSLSLFLCSLSSSAHKIVLWATIELAKLSEKNDYATNTRSMHPMRKMPCVSCQGDSGCYGEGLVLLWDTMTQKYIHKIVTR